MDWQFAALEKEKNICGIDISVTGLNGTECSNEQEKGQLEVVAILRIFTSCLSILGALSIIGSALYRKTFCNPKVHPLFVLSIADLMLSILWICGSVIWLKGGFQKGHWRVRCFSINLMTVILQCVAMNLTLLYALLAYSSIKQKDFSGVYMVQQRSDSVHVWHPLCSFTAYLIAWMLPVFIIMIPFGIMSSYYGLVRLANTCSCWCMPYLGNVIPKPHLKIPNNKDEYLKHLQNFVAFYGATISANFLFVLVCMIIIYYKVFKRIRRMGKTQEQNETTPLYGATQAMILEGQKDARTRVLLFIAVFFLSGSVTLAFTIREINNYYNHNHGQHHGIYRLYIMLVIEALFVPIQGFLNAAVYGWTRGDFLNVMSSRKVYSRPNHFSLSYENEEETVVEDDGEEDGERWQGESQRMGNSILFLSMEQEGGSSPISRRQGASNAITPGSPGVLLGGGSTD